MYVIWDQKAGPEPVLIFDSLGPKEVWAEPIPDPKKSSPNFIFRWDRTLGLGLGKTQVSLIHMQGGFRWWKMDGEILVGLAC